MNERCKHDLLHGQCSFCSGSSSLSTGQVMNEESMEWLQRLREPLRSPLTPGSRIDHQSPQPGASAGSTANRAISRQRQ